MSDKVSGRKQPSVGPRQAMSRETGTRSSDMSVYKSSAEESVNIKGTKESSIYKSSEEYFEYSCDPCKTAGDDAEAQGFCTNCDEYLCSMCFRTHSRNKSSKHHTLLDKDAMPRKSVKLCDPCKTVGDKIDAVGYCKDCNDYLCDICYKSHSRNKSSRHHVLVDKANMSEEFDRAVSSAFAHMHMHKEGAADQKWNEEYICIRKIHIKTDTDENDCYITGMTLVSNTELVLCDYTNSYLKLVDIEKNIIKDVSKVQEKMYGITAISKDKLAVVLEDKYQIQIISIPGGLSPVRTIKTNGDCLDVKLTNGKLYVSFCRPVKFQIRQLTGAVSKTIKPSSEVLKHCSFPRHIAVCPDESMIYVSDWETNKVMSIDMDGNMVSLFQGDVELPKDIIISQFGSVYLCNRNQDSVYKMTPDLSAASVILGPGDGVIAPGAMSFNVDKEQLYIISGSTDAKYRNFIKVYKWK